MRRTFAVLAAFFACLALPAGVLAYAEYPYLNSVASWLSGKSVEVRCLNERESKLDLTIGFWGASAYVEADNLGHPKRYTVFAWPLCKQLRDFRAGLRGLDEDTAWAIFVLVHESGHMRDAGWLPWRDEGIINVWALKRTYAVAVLRFGLIDTIEAKFAFNRLLLGIYMGQPDRYRPLACQHPDLLPSGDIRCKS